jgi:hypothetical protein
MDGMIIHENVNHVDSINVTVIENAVDEIRDLRVGNDFNKSN